jgi:hypothetical protein
MLPDLIDQRSEQLAGGANPTGKSRAIQINALAGKYLRLPIEGRVIPVLGNQNMSQQGRTRQATLDRPCRSRSFDDMFASCAGELRPHMTDYLKACRDALQLLGYVLAKQTQRSTAIGAAGVRRKMGDNFPRKILRKRLACGTPTGLGYCLNRTRMRNLLRILDSFICGLGCL